MKFVLLSFLLLICINLPAQTLVSNGSFETHTSCPDDFFQIYKAESWFSPDCAPLRPDTHGYAVLFSNCNYTNAGVPYNAICTQDAHTGFSYAGIEVLSAFDGVYRQYIETKLTSALEPGKKYYFSMYFNLCEQYPDRPDQICFVADSTGAAFSATPVDKNPNCLTIPLQPDVHASSLQIKPGNQWHHLDGCYIAKGGEEYLIIGNFGGEAVSNCSSLNTLAYFIFIDDVALIPEVRHTFDTTLCVGEPWKVDATGLRNEYKTFDGWKYVWSDGDSSSVRNFTKAENRQLTVRNKDCFEDVYNFNISIENICGCQFYVPNVFTPNNDGLNEIFIPRITCSTVDIFNYQFSVFNRWGQKVFSTKNKTEGWDGAYRGVRSGNEVFAWMIQYDVKQGLNTLHKKLSGTVLTLQ